MIMQLSHHVADCPACGRPVEIEAESLDREMACGHCGGRFVVYRSADQQPIAAVIREQSLLERADRILRTANRTAHVSRTLIVVEHRDEVFARIAADAEQFEMVVLRAESVGSALRLVSRCDSALVVANRDLPGQNGWVLADKLNLIAPHVEVWLYMPDTSTYAELLARFLKVTELLEYGGDLFSLSDAVTQRLADWCGPKIAPIRLESWPPHETASVVRL